jgi:hypothetical protein
VLIYEHDVLLGPIELGGTIESDVATEQRLVDLQLAGIEEAIVAPADLESEVEDLDRAVALAGAIELAEFDERREEFGSEKGVLSLEALDGAQQFQRWSLCGRHTSGRDGAEQE